jgi:hypothetical protein
MTPHEVLTSIGNALVNEGYADSFEIIGSIFAVTRPPDVHFDFRHDAEHNTLLFPFLEIQVDLCNRCRNQVISRIPAIAPRVAINSFIDSFIDSFGRQ